MSRYIWTHSLKHCYKNSQIWELGTCLLSAFHTLIHVIALDRVHFQEETIKLPVHRWGYYGQFWYEQPYWNGNTLHSEAWNADAWLYIYYKHQFPSHYSTECSLSCAQHCHTSLHFFVDLLLHILHTRSKMPSVDPKFDGLGT
jgi:hypothetical protein